MLDWFRERLKPAEIRHEERVTAYIDGQLRDSDRAALEREMRADRRMQQEVEGLRMLKSELGRLPQQPVPRNFTLDPAVYGKPEPATVARSYPALRVATAFAAVMFIFMLTLGVTQGVLGPQNDMAEIASEPLIFDSDAAEEGVSMAAEAPPAEEALAADSAAESQAQVLSEPAEELAVVVEEESAELEVAEEDTVEFEVAADAADGEDDAGNVAGTTMVEATEEAFAVAREGVADDAADSDDESAAVVQEEAARTLKQPEATAQLSQYSTESEVAVVEPTIVPPSDDTVAASVPTQRTLIDGDAGTPLITVLLIVSGILFLILLALTLLARRRQRI